MRRFEYKITIIAPQPQSHGRPIWPGETEGGWELVSVMPATDYIDPLMEAGSEVANRVYAYLFFKREIDAKE